MSRDDWAYVAAWTFAVVFGLVLGAVAVGCWLVQS